MATIWPAPSGGAGPVAVETNEIADAVDAMFGVM